MEEIILQILDALRRGETVDDRALVKLVHAQTRRAGGDKRAFAKRRLLPFYQRVKREEPERWARWGITPELEEGLIKVLLCFGCGDYHRHHEAMAVFGFMHLLPERCAHAQELSGRRACLRPRRTGLL